MVLFFYASHARLWYAVYLTQEGRVGGIGKDPLAAQCKALAPDPWGGLWIKPWGYPA